MAVSSIGDISLTALRQSLVVGQAQESEQGAPQALAVSSVGDVSLTPSQESLVVGQAEDSEQGAPQAITTGHFITEGVNDLLPLDHAVRVGLHVEEHVGAVRHVQRLAQRVDCKAPPAPQGS